MATIEELGLWISEKFVGEQRPGFDDAMALRYAVFCDEQKVPREIEHDAEDALATHLLLRDPAGKPAATGRVLRQRADGTLVALADAAQPGDLARIGRMAVRADLRRVKLGARVLRQLEQIAQAAGLPGAMLHAQRHAEPFYGRAGYAPHGPEFDEAGIPHVEMHKALGRS